MNVFRARKLYTELQPEQRRFLRGKHLDSDFAADEWLRFFERLADFDGCLDAVRVVSAVVLVLLVPVGFLAHACLGPGAGYTVLGVGAILALGLTSLIFWLYGLDLPNNFREFTIPLVRELEARFPSEGKLHLKLDFRGGLVPEKRQSRFKADRRVSLSAGRDRGKQTYFEDAWLKAELAPAHGGSVEVTVLDRICRFAKPTGSASYGVQRVKIEYEVRRELTLVLTPPTSDGDRDPEPIHVHEYLRYRKLDQALDPKVLVGMLDEAKGSAAP